MAPTKHPSLDLEVESAAEKAAIVAGLPQFNPFAKGENGLMGIGTFEKEQRIHIGKEETKRLCGGVTPLLGTQWAFHSKFSGLSVEVNTSHCAFVHRPQYLVSVVSTAARPHLTRSFNFSGTISITKSKKGFVQVLVLNPLVPTDQLMQIARDQRWQISWVAGGGINTGITIKGSTGWRTSGLEGHAAHLLYVDVDTIANGFRSTPTYFTALHAKESEYPSLGATMVFRPTEKGFRVYIKTDDLVTPIDAEDRGWQISFIGVAGCGAGGEAGQLLHGKQYGCSSSGFDKWTMLYPPKPLLERTFSGVPEKKQYPNAASLSVTTAGIHPDLVKHTLTAFPAYAMSLTYAGGHVTPFKSTNSTKSSIGKLKYEELAIHKMMGVEDDSDLDKVQRDVSVIGAGVMYILNSSQQTSTDKPTQGFAVYLRPWEMRAEDEPKRRVPLGAGEWSGMWKVNYLAYAGEWDHPCVVAKWDPWDICSKLCDGGKQARFRKVVQKAQNGGAACPPVQQVRECNTVKCPKLACEVSGWATWGTCSENCTWVMSGMVITGLQNRSREVVRAPISGGKKCPQLIQQRNCNIRPCTARDCMMSPWSEWGTCTKSCEGGNHTRTRKILRLPLFAGKACGVSTNTTSCNVGECPPVPCQTSLWSVWGLCSKSCGNGTHTRFRQVTQKPAFGAAACPSLTSDGVCNSEPCPLDCRLSDPKSAAWSECTTNYDNGTGLCGHMMGWTYKRLAVTHQPMYGGKKCGNRDLQQQRCTQVDSCPGKGASSICGGLTQGAQPWREKGKHALTLTVDTTSCNFGAGDGSSGSKAGGAVPQYVVSVVGTASDSFFGLVTPTATITHMTATGFVLTAYYPFMVSMELLKEATKYSWQASWVGDSGINSGVSVGGNTGWVQQTGNPKAVYVDISTKGCGFAKGSTPRYFASLHGNQNNFKAFGASVVYKPTAVSFRMYVLFPIAITPAMVEEWEWSVGWIGTSDEVLSMEQEVYSGTALYDTSDANGAKGWTHGTTKLGAPLMYSKVDTADAGFQHPPAYILSVQVAVPTTISLGY
jgi:hypothetical protein